MVTGQCNIYFVAFLMRHLCICYYVDSAVSPRSSTSQLELTSWLFALHSYKYLTKIPGSVSAHTASKCCVLLASHFSANMRNSQMSSTAVSQQNVHCLLIKTQP